MGGSGAGNGRLDAFRRLRKSAQTKCQGFVEGDNSPGMLDFAIQLGHGVFTVSVRRIDAAV